ncbi:MAG TPA: hypothetical protein PLC13_02945, partial [Bacillota bacterium]|nr:hypothetical protein [Bacillota bacterium]
MKRILAFFLSRVYNISVNIYKKSAQNKNTNKERRRKGVWVILLTPKPENLVFFIFGAFLFYST